MRGRPAVVIAAIVGVAVAGAFGSQLLRTVRTGPFELWALRAGMAFETIDDREHAATKRRFVCLPLEETGKFCQLHDRGAKGMVRLFVDANGRTVVAQFWPAGEDTRIGDEARRMSAEWTLVRVPRTAQLDGARTWETTSRWQSSDRHWSATMQYSCFASTPTVIEVADEAALTAVMARYPRARELLASANLVATAEEAALSEAPRRAPGQCGTPVFTAPEP
jgi:hypothetical protein